MQPSGVLGRFQLTYCIVSFLLSGQQAPCMTQLFLDFGDRPEFFMLSCESPTAWRIFFMHDICQWCWGAPTPPSPPPRISMLAYSQTHCLGNHDAVTQACWGAPTPLPPPPPPRISMLAYSEAHCLRNHDSVTQTCWRTTRKTAMATVGAKAACWRPLSGPSC